MPRYLVRFEPEYKEGVRAGLGALGVVPAAQVLDYFVVDVPEELVPRIKVIPHVVEVRSEGPIRIKRVIPVEKKLSKFLELARNPLTLPQAFAFSLEADRLLERWTTAEARRMLGVHEAEAEGYTGKGIRVGVLDTGVDPPCLQAPGLFGKSTVEGEEFFSFDTNGHSVWCYSALGGKSLWTPFGEIKGVAPDVELRIYKVLGYTIGTGSTTSVIRGMADAFADGCKILSMSLGGPEENPAVSPECRVAKALTDQGTILCVAVGNDGEGTIGTPGNSPDVITVGAIDKEGKVAEFSGSKGDKPDSVPSYSAIIIRRNGFVDCTTIEDLWNIIDKPVISSGNLEWKDCHNVEIYQGLCTHGKVWTPIKKIFRHYYDGQLLRIRTLGGIVDVSPNHSLIDPQGRIINAERVKEEEKLHVVGLDYYFNNREFFVGAPELAEFLGFFAADGFCSLGKRYSRKNSYRYMVGFDNIDKDLVDRYENIFERYFGKKLAHHSHKGSFANAKECHKRYIRDKECYEFFRSRFYTSDNKKKVPTEILNASPAIKKAFLKGFENGDDAHRKRNYRVPEFQGWDSNSEALLQGTLILAHESTNLGYRVENRDNKPNIKTIVFTTRYRLKERNKVKKVTPIYYKGFLYDLETESHTFTTGVGPIRVHNTVAPGVHVLSSTVGLIDVMQTQDFHRLGCISGSSMATPMVAGMMAIWTQYLREQGVELTAEIAKDIMARYGLTPKHPRLGWGVPQWEWIKIYAEEVS